VRKAVIDVGSNSVLLVVAERQDGAWVPIHEATSVTALGEGTKTTGLLGEPGMTATLSALKDFFAKAREMGADPILSAATMAARIATNTPDFLARAEAQGTPTFVLSGDDEAQLGFLAVAEDPLFKDKPRISIIDPGGQSTEIVTADRANGEWVVHFRQSFAVGTLGLRSTILPNERLEPSDMFRAFAFLDDLIGKLPDEDAGEAVVLGATGTNLITIRERMTEWQPEKVHGAWLDYEEVSKAFGWLGPMSDMERAVVVGIEKGRERTIHLGALILERALFALRCHGCRVSVRGWRHALLDHPVPSASS